MVSVDVKHHVYLLSESCRESRRDQEEGRELDSYEKVRLPFAGPGELKRKEVSWTLTKRLDFFLPVQARSRGQR